MKKKNSSLSQSQLQQSPLVPILNSSEKDSMNQDKNIDSLEIQSNSSCTKSQISSQIDPTHQSIQKFINIILNTNNSSEEKNINMQNQFCPPLIPHQNQASKILPVPEINTISKQDSQTFCLQKKPDDIPTISVPPKIKAQIKLQMEKPDKF